MAMPTDIHSPDYDADAEANIIEAIGAMLLSVAADFGFDGSHTHTRARYPSDKETWKAIALIQNPQNTEDFIMRMIQIECISASSVQTKTTFGYVIKVGFGFEDERKDSNDVVIGNSSDDLKRLCLRAIGLFRHNLNLGLDDSVSHGYIQWRGKRFVAADEQGNAADVADLTLDVTLEVC